MPVARHPPHRSVRALLTHTVLTLDVWTQSAPPDTDAGSRLPGSGARVSPEIAPMSSGSVDSAGEAATTTCVALRAETPSVGPRCAGPHGTGNIREPPTGATPQCPWSSRAGARAVSAESASTWLPFACRSKQFLPNLLQLGCHSLADRLPVHLEVSRPMILPTDMSETQKIKGFRLPCPTLLPPFSGITPKFNQTRLLWM